MVIEVRPWSGRLGLTKVREPLFLFKNQPFQSFGPLTSAPIDVKTGYQIRRILLRFGVQFRFRVWVYWITILVSSSCSHDQWPSGSYLDWLTWRDQPQAYKDGCANRRGVALIRPIFKRKNGFANLSLGLIYHSKALPQPTSHDTIPLIQPWAYSKEWTLFSSKETSLNPWQLLNNGWSWNF
jgi:hypothetical protein